MSNNQQKKDLYEYIIEHDVYNTHTHHLQDTFFRDLSLKKIFEQSYVHWQKYPLTNDYNSRYNYLSKIRYKSYFVWLEKALQNIYNFSDSITPNNWDMIDKMIISTYQKDNNYNLDILKNKCNYTEIILDAYWKPGSDNYHPEVFKSTFRIDPLLQGYSIKPVDHDGNSPFKLYNRVFSNLDEYVDWIKILIKQQKTDGCIALKSAVAYDRGLDFHNTSRNRAKKIFEIKDKDFTPDIIKDFQDYVFQIICELAAE